MTEEEARERWCPMVRKEMACQGSINRWDNDDKVIEFGCVASQCMMWRWHRLPSGHEKCVGPYSKTYGYCGLAGIP